jgi:Reverse transcriptase (RNA-dependent DNA polymerase)
LVAKEYTQTYEIDYEQTFTPVAKMNTVRILLSVVVNQKWTLHQMDVKNTFLQGMLEEEVYMAPPPGYIQQDNSNLVCKLEKLIYGLKQSLRVWYDKLSSYLLSCNFLISNADHSLLSKIINNTIIVILIYVDDLIIAENNLEEIKRVNAKLKEMFDIKDLGVLKYFLGIEIAHSPKGIFISQRKYTLDLLKETEKLGCKPISTPIDSKVKLNIDNGEPVDNIN